MRFYMNILTTYFPDRDPPYDIYYHQILEQIELAEKIGLGMFHVQRTQFSGLWADQHGYDMMTVGICNSPEKVRLGVEACREG
jgi:hypothetical protein